jgi:hypothetical protein
MIVPLSGASNIKGLFSTTQLLREADRWHETQNLK